MKNFFDGMFSIFRRLFYLLAFVYVSIGVYFVGQKIYDQYRYWQTPPLIVLDNASSQKNIIDFRTKVETKLYGEKSFKEIWIKVQHPKGMSRDDIILQTKKVPNADTNSYEPVGTESWFTIIMMIMAPLWAWMIHQLAVWICWGKKPALSKVRPKNIHDHIEPTI